MTEQISTVAWFANNNYGSPSNLEDGNLTTYVQAFTYCCADLGGEYVLDELLLAVHNTTAYNHLVAGTSTLQGSNDTTNGSDGTWTTLLTFSSSNYTAPASYPGYGGTVSVDTGGEAYRFYRITDTTQSTSQVLNEWQLWCGAAAAAFDPSIVVEENKRTITLDSSVISSDQTDFPLMLKITDADIFTELGNNYLKLSLEDGTSQLPIEIAYWDAVSNVGIIFSKLSNYPSSADGELTFSFDASQADNTDYVGAIGDTIAQSVWSNGYSAVFHFADASSIVDSTGNGNDGTLYAGVLVDSFLGKGVSFDGSSTYSSTGTALGWSGDLEGNITALLSPNSISSLTTPYVAGVQSTNRSFGLAIYNGALSAQFNGGSQYVETTGSVVNGSYQALSVNKSAGVINTTTSLYRNGVGPLAGSGATSTPNFGAGLSYIGQWTNGGYKFNGIFDELRLSSVSRSTDWSILEQLSLLDQLATWSGGGSDSAVVYRNGLEMAWKSGEVYLSGLDMVWKAALANGLKMIWGPAPVCRNGLLMPWRGGYIVNRGLLMKWSKAKTYREGLQMLWHELGLHRNGLQMTWPDVAGAYRNGLEMVFDVTDKELVRNGNQMVWFGGGSSVDQVYSVGVTFGGEAINPAQINIRRSRSEYVIECKLAMVGDPDDIVGERLPRKYAYLTEAEKIKARELAAVVISIDVNGDVETVELLATSISDSVTVDGCDYTIVAESVGVLLDAPYALSVTDEFGPGMIGAMMEELASGYPVSFSWGGVNWWVTGGVLYGNGEVPIDIIRKPKEAIGGMIQSDLDGSLRVLPYYPVSKKDWLTTDADQLFYVNENLWSCTRTDDDRSDANSFLIGDTLSSSASLTYDTVDVAYGVKYIRAFEVPWTGENPGLDTSGPDRVIIQAGMIVTETITKEQVEIVSGEGKTEKPIYQIIDRDYGENTQLGAISYAEDGTINTEIAGQSIVLVSYVTKYWQWKVKDHVQEDVQFFSMPVWSDVPVALVVTFGDAAAASGFVVAEPDDTLNVDSGGEVLSELPQGQPFNFLLQHDDTIALESVTVSAGSIVKLGTVMRTKSDRLEFADASSVELPYIPAGDVDIDWYGRSPQIKRNGRELTPVSYPAIGEVEYAARMQSFALNPPSMSLGVDDNYYILIVLNMVSV